MPVNRESSAADADAAMCGFNQAGPRREFFLAIRELPDGIYPLADFNGVSLAVAQVVYRRLSGLRTGGRITESFFERLGFSLAIDDETRGKAEVHVIRAMQKEEGDKAAREARERKLREVCELNERDEQLAETAERAALERPATTLETPALGLTLEALRAELAPIRATLATLDALQQDIRLLRNEVTALRRDTTALRADFDISAAILRRVDHNQDSFRNEAQALWEGQRGVRERVERLEDSKP